VRGNRTILILEPARKRIRPKVPKGRSKNAMRVYRYERAKKKKGERERERERKRERESERKSGRMARLWVIWLNRESVRVKLHHQPL